jgi:hypothetical protein
LRLIREPLGMSSFKKEKKGERYEEVGQWRRRRTEEVQNSQKWSFKFVITVVITVNIKINRNQIRSQQLFTVAEILTRYILVSRSGYRLIHATLCTYSMDRQIIILCWLHVRKSGFNSRTKQKYISSSPHEIRLWVQPRLLQSTPARRPTSLSLFLIVSPGTVQSCGSNLK